jgi:carbamoyltransferase
MNIIGISAFYHDSAACLITDGEIIAAVQEERFSRIKHDPSFPVKSIEYCLKESGLTLDDIDQVVFYEKPLLKFDRIVKTFVYTFPKGAGVFLKAIPKWLTKKLFTNRLIHKELKKLDGSYKKKVAFCEHHQSHAASAFYPSPYNEAAILTIDGVGEWDTTTISKGHGKNLELIYSQKFPHSLGLLYSAFTYYTGFKVNSGEYKLMGLAPYGEPIYVDLIKENLINTNKSGFFSMNMDYFSYHIGGKMINKKFEDLFGHPARERESELTKFYLDVAASIQKVTEEIVLKTVDDAYEKTKCDYLCLAGGVALNCVANGRVLRESKFKKVWIQPAAGDCGGALGCALYYWHQILDNTRVIDLEDSQNGSLLGPSYSEEEIHEFLESNSIEYLSCNSEEELCDKVAKHIADQKVVGWFQGRSEFGPRALGCRSILGDARSLEMQKTMNLKIKFRESFRPFAPSVLAEDAHKYFKLDKNIESPYMLLVTEIADSQKKPDKPNNTKGLEKLDLERSKLQAITHVDYSARVQTVDKTRNPIYRKLIKSFKELTGCPVIVNTSFNVRGEPIVNSPKEAFSVFEKTGMDILVLGNCIIIKRK